MPSTKRGTKQYETNAADKAPKQLAKYIFDSWTNFAEIERRIFLKYISKKKTIKLLKQAVQDEGGDLKNLQSEWKKREEVWQ